MRGPYDPHSTLMGWEVARWVRDREAFDLPAGQPKPPLSQPQRPSLVMVVLVPLLAAALIVANAVFFRFIGAF